MTIADQAQNAVGKSIGEICANGYDDNDISHCAHFVSHICGIDKERTCRSLTDGRNKGANVRVHELFELCPQVGLWDEADVGRTQLIFVTRDRSVDLASGVMKNRPQKHVGIYHGGHVYHYRNNEEVVGDDTVEQFFNYFQSIYDGDQELFFGHIPGENLVLNIDAAGTSASAGKKFELIKEDRQWFARESQDQDRFYIGNAIDQPDDNYFGLGSSNIADLGPRFSATQYEEEFGPWAFLLQVTGQCESRNFFNCVNAYDRAKFTFGFYQLAAHTPNDNLILLFRALAKLNAFNDYFPELKVREGRLYRHDGDGGTTDLEVPVAVDNSQNRRLQHFMDYLNPTRKSVDLQEALMAARLIHWTTHDELARRCQVEVAADILQSKMENRYDRKLALNGRSATVCAIVADIFHQGRSTYRDVKPLLHASDPVEALLTHRNENFEGRNRRLRRAIEPLLSTLDRYVYVSAVNDFRQVRD